MTNDLLILNYLIIIKSLVSRWCDYTRNLFYLQKIICFRLTNKMELGISLRPTKIRTWYWPLFQSVRVQIKGWQIQKNLFLGLEIERDENCSLHLVDVDHWHQQKRKFAVLNLEFFFSIFWLFGVLLSYSCVKRYSSNYCHCSIQIISSYINIVLMLKYWTCFSSIYVILSCAYWFF